MLRLSHLSGNASLANAEGTTSVLAPLGSPYVTVPIDGAGILGPNESRTVTLEFAVTSSAPITYDTRLLSEVPVLLSVSPFASIRWLGSTGGYRKRWSPVPICSLTQNGAFVNR